MVAPSTTNLFIYLGYNTMVAGFTIQLH